MILLPFTFKITVHILSILFGDVFSRL